MTTEAIRETVELAIDGARIAVDDWTPLSREARGELPIVFVHAGVADRRIRAAFLSGDMTARSRSVSNSGSSGRDGASQISLRTCLSCAEIWPG
jgi:hypothetical protein